MKKEVLQNPKHRRNHAARASPMIRG